MTQGNDMGATTIETLDAERMERWLPDLAVILRETTLDGSSVGFLPPFPLEESLTYWRTIQADLAQGKRIVLVATRDGRLLGTVQLELMWKPNQPHRVELQKLLVAMDARNQGLGRRLMLAAEDATRASGRRLIVLDTQTDSIAHGLYQRMGYHEAGQIPNFALLPDGSYCPTTVLYKELGPSA
ncbi:MAG TPA: GNAT family N-acetyltransferase [Ktedonobacterales bacterium]